MYSLRKASLVTFVFRKVYHRHQQFQNISILKRDRRFLFTKDFKVSTLATRIFSFRKRTTVSFVVDSSQNAPLTDIPAKYPLQSLSDLKTSHFSTSTLTSEEVIQMRKERGNYKIPIPLSNKEIRVFSLQENKDVNSLIQDLKHEDVNIKDVVILDMEGKRIARSTPIEDLLKCDWKLRIDGHTYIVRSPPRSQVGGEHVEISEEHPTYQKVRAMFEERAKNQTTMSLNEYYEWAEDMGLTHDQAKQILSDMHHLGVILHFDSNQELRNVIFLHPKKISSQIETALNLPFLRINTEEKMALVKKLREELAPLEEQRKILEYKAWRSANLIVYGTLLFLCCQFILFARLTWWESDWDVMEPVTYFTTVVETVMAGYFYYIFTQRDYSNDDARTFLFRRKMKKLLKRTKFPVEKYTTIRDQIQNLIAEIKHVDPKAAESLLSEI